MILQDLPGRRTEAHGIFGVYPAFDRVAVDHDIVLRRRQLAAGGDTDLLQHQIDIGDHLGDGMLDLDAGVHLDEKEFAILVEELHRTDAQIFELLHRLCDRQPDLGAGGRIERRRGAFLPDLLVTPLQRAVALAEMDRAATAVTEYLDLDVTRLLQIFLQIDRGIAEGRFGFVGSRLKRKREVVGGMGDLHAASAAPGRSLHQKGKTDLLGDCHGVVVGADCAVRARHHGNAKALCGLLGLDLVAHQADVLRLRSDEMQIVIGEDFGKTRVLGEKTVAGMNRIHAGNLAGCKQRRHVEIAVLRGWRPDADAFIGEPHMHRIVVGGGMDRDRGNPQFLARPQDAKSNLAAIGYEDLIEHRFSMGEWRVANRKKNHSPPTIRYSMITRGSPNSTGWPSSTRI